MMMGYERKQLRPVPRREVKISCAPRPYGVEQRSMCNDGSARKGAMWQIPHLMRLPPRQTGLLARSFQTDGNVIPFPRLVS